MRFRLDIQMGNDDVQDQHDVARLMRDVASRLSSQASSGWSPYALSGKILDRNGNTVGTWSVEP